MPSTYEPIATTILGSAASSVTFSSISGTYTDFILIGSYVNSASANTYVQVGNGSVDTGSNYSMTYLSGNGSSAVSGRDTSVAQMDLAYGLTGVQLNLIYQFQNYSNTTTYKTVLARNNDASNQVAARVALWRSTSAINVIKIYPSTGNFNTGSTFTLYGIKAA
jgi:hypothetical protein